MAALLGLIIGLPAAALAQSQDTAVSPPTTTGAAAQTNPNDSSTYASGKPLATQSNEGFWGHLNPFARKQWVNRQVNPVKDRLNELDQLSAKNGNDIKSVDERAQGGILNAQQTADRATQQAATASTTAASAKQLASDSGQQTLRLSSTVASLDQYHPVSDTEIRFRPGQSILNAKAKDALDGIASQLQGQKGYLIEVQGYAHARGEAGVQNSQRLADSVVRYLVEEHNIPVYRVHEIGMGNALPQNYQGETIRGSAVHVTLVQNSLAALTPTGTSGGSPIGATQSSMQNSSNRSAASPPSAQ